MPVLPKSLSRALETSSLAALVLLFLTRAAHAEGTIDTGDTAWMMTSTLLVLLMALPGLALFYGGLVRTKNLLSVLMQCMFSAGMIGVLWVLVGYSLAFGEGNAFIGDLSMAGLAGITPDSVSGTIPTYVFVMFQGMFAIITPALMLGAFAERMRFSVYAVFITIWVFVVYIPLAHMVWGGGYIATEIEALDFAGGLVVHMSSGFSALVAAIIVGPRLGYGRESMAPNSLPLTVIGAALLWVGWFGFNAGSELAADGVAARRHPRPRRETRRRRRRRRRRASARRLTRSEPRQRRAPSLARRRRRAAAAAIRLAALGHVAWPPAIVWAIRTANRRATAAAAEPRQRRPHL